MLEVKSKGCTFFTARAALARRTSAALHFFLGGYLHVMAALLKVITVMTFLLFPLDWSELKAISEN